MRKLQLCLLVCLTLLLAACTSGNTGNTTTTPTAVPVNGFGTAANHVHSLITLPDADHTLVLATHYGIFRSQDQGATWQQTAGGPGQSMQSVMTYQLSYNPLDPQRLYVLTYIQGAPNPHASTLGLYTSGDSGKTWQMAIADSSVTTSSIFFAQAGNDSPSEVYIYLSSLGPLGLKVSKDNGQHFAQAGSALPFGTALGMLALPGQPGHLLVFGNNGIATTSDGGAHWQTSSSVQGGIFEMTTAGANNPIYASGDAGVYASTDGGKTFNLVSQESYGALAASAQQPDVLYGKLALGVYRSTNGGKTWQELPVLKISQQALTGDVLSVDSTDANQVYLAISYPVAVYQFQSTNSSWKSVTPSV